VTDKASEARETAAALRLAVSLLMRRLREVSAEGDLTAPELSTLSLIDRGGPITIADLARRQQITPQATGATVASLGAAGLLAKESDPHDKRRSLFTLNDAGRQALHSGRSATVDRMADALRESFTADEIATVAAAAPLVERIASLL